MSAKTATLIGATGLIGGELLELLLQDDFFQHIRVIVRGPFSKHHPKLEKKIIDFNDNDSFLVALDNSDVVFCAVGTTQKKVGGDKVAYRKVDFDIPVHAARFCKMVRCNCFAVVSSVGANSKARNFYLQLKGEMEEAVKASGVESIHFMRPSILLGDRKESRPVELIGKIVMQGISFFMTGIFHKYKPIHAKTVAKAMIAVAKKSEPGFFIYEHDKMKGLERSKSLG